MILVELLMFFCDKGMWCFMHLVQLKTIRVQAHVKSEVVKTSIFFFLLYDDVTNY